MDVHFPSKKFWIPNVATMGNVAVPASIFDAKGNINNNFGFAGTTLTYSSVPIGTSSGRTVVVGTIIANARTVTSVTVTPTAGAPVTAIQAAVTPRSDMWYAAIPDGATTADVQVVWSGNIGVCGFGVGVLTGMNATPTANVVYPLTNNFADPQVFPSLTVPAGGVGVFFGGLTSGSSVDHNPTTVAAPGIYDSLLGGVNTGGVGVSYTGGHSLSTVAFSITGTNSNGWGFGGFAGTAVAWGP